MHENEQVNQRTNDNQTERAKRGRKKKRNNNTP